MKKVKITRVQRLKESNVQGEVGESWTGEEYAPPKDGKMYSGSFGNFEVIKVLPGYIVTEISLLKLEYI